MLPETCEPTCTEVTALMVPVASTTARTSPRSTREVKYWVLSLRLRPKAANSTTAATMTATIVHLLFNTFTRQKAFLYDSGYAARTYKCSVLCRIALRVLQSITTQHLL